MIATNIGSLPWRGGPLADDLERALRGHAEGTIAPEELQQVQDRATRQAVQAQIDAGLDHVTDGLVRRGDPISHVSRRFAGVTAGEEKDGCPGIRGTYRVPRVEDAIAWSGPILVEDYLFAKEGVDRSIKVVLTGPFTLAKVAEDRAYDDPNALAMGMATALNQEIRALQEAGVTMVQIDEPALLVNKSEFPVFTRLWEVLGRGVTADLALHLPGGDVSGLYPGLLRLKRLAWLSLDLVAGRASLDLFRKHPQLEGPGLGLGLIDSGSESIEDPDALASLIKSTQGIPPPDRLWIGPATDLSGLSHPLALDKLRSAARAARLVDGA